MIKSIKVSQDSSILFFDRSRRVDTFNTSFSIVRYSREDLGSIIYGPLKPYLRNSIYLDWKLAVASSLIFLLLATKNLLGGKISPG